MLGSLRKLRASKIHPLGRLLESPLACPLELQPSRLAFPPLVGAAASFPLRVQRLFATLRQRRWRGCGQVASQILSQRAPVQESPGPLWRDVRSRKEAQGCTQGSIR